MVLIVRCAGRPQSPAGKSAGAAGTGRRWSRRRVIALGEAVLELSSACAFEARFHATAQARDANGGNLLASLLPRKTEPELEKKAQAALQAAKAAVAEGRLEDSVPLFSQVLALAPDKYKLCQAALLGRAEALGKLGRSEEQRRDSIQNWCWGRGVRWPGHYIIAYLLARRGFVEDETASASTKLIAKSKALSGARGGRSSRSVGRAAVTVQKRSASAGRSEKPANANNKQNRSQQRVGTKVAADRKPQDNSGLTEALVLVVGAGLYNYILFTYGLEY